MVAAKPIVVTQIATDDYDGPAPQPTIIVGGIPALAADVQAADITDSTTVGRAVLTAANAGAARTAIGATAIGSTILTAADAPAVRTALGVAAFVAVDDTPADAAAVAADLIAIRAAIIAAGWMAAS